MCQMHITALSLVNALCRCRFCVGFDLGIGGTDQNREMTVIFGFRIGKLLDNVGFAGGVKPKPT